MCQVLYVRCSRFRCGAHRSPAANGSVTSGLSRATPAVTVLIFYPATLHGCAVRDFECKIDAALAATTVATRVAGTMARFTSSNYCQAGASLPRRVDYAATSIKLTITRAALIGPLKHTRNRNRRTYLENNLASMRAIGSLGKIVPYQEIGAACLEKQRVRHWPGRILPFCYERRIYTASIDVLELSHVKIILWKYVICFRHRDDLFLFFLSDSSIVIR